MLRALILFIQTLALGTPIAVSAKSEKEIVKDWLVNNGSEVCTKECMDFMVCEIGTEPK
tara:strand:- start:6132 stop:6308 length:177 start_codon:yes stop_codon:yes gene_type:complete